MSRLNTTLSKITICFSVAFFGANISAFAAMSQDDTQERMNATVDSFLRASETPTAEDWSAGQQLKTKFDQFVHSLRGDENNNLSSFELNGKQYQAVFDNGKLRSVAVGGITSTFSLAQSTDGKEKRIVVMDVNGVTVGQDSPKVISIMAPQLASLIEGAVSLDSRSTESIGSTRTATSIAAFRSVDRSKAVKTPEMCNSECDGQKEMEMAGCDGFFEAEIGLIAVLGVMVPEIPDARLRTLALAALAASGLIAATNKYTCKAGAIAAWGACRASC